MSEIKEYIFPRIKKEIGNMIKFMKAKVAKESPIKLYPLAITCKNIYQKE